MINGWLTGWKAIAEYVGLHVQTCKRYKKRYSMPISYLPGGTPVAIPYELDEWLISLRKLKQKSTTG